MKQIDLLNPVVRVLAAGAFCLAVAGCGGSGGSGGGNNPYAGSYSGQFIDQDDFIGTVTMTVATDGTVNGSFGYGSPISFTGNVTSGGTGTIQDTNGTFPIKFGSANRSTLGAGIGTSTAGAFLTLVTNPDGAFNGFSGDYAGTVHNTTLNKTGIIALTVSSTGVVAGVDLFPVNGTATLEPISGTLNSGGALSYTVHGVTVTGTVTLSGSTVSGPVHESNGNDATFSVNQVSP